MGCKLGNRVKRMMTYLKESRLAFGFYSYFENEKNSSKTH